jgi:rod shape determining protein RodA
VSFWNHGLPAYLNRLRHHFDWSLVLPVLLICVVGVFNLFSITTVSGKGSYIPQIRFMLLGFAGMFVVSALDDRFLKRSAYTLFGIGAFLLVAVFVVGNTVKGSARWIGYGPLRIQPSEVMKVLLILALARYLHDDPAVEGRTLRELAVPFVMVAVPMALILKQPDLGTALILGLIFFTVMLATKLKLRSLFTLLATLTAAAPASWVYLLHDYQRARILAFLNPASDTQGANWHARQSMLAVGSGGWTGKGFMASTQNRLHMLPEPQTDFAFAVYCEEWGFVGAVVLLALYFVLILSAVSIAARARDRFGAVVAFGVASLLFWHVVINAGMVIGVLPVVGVTMPLFSYGGSSTVTTLIGIGLLMNVSLRRWR